MPRHYIVVSILVVLFFSASIPGALAADDTEQPHDVASALARRIISVETPIEEARAFTESRIPAMPECETLEEWNRHAERLRQEMFDHVVFRGEAARWRDADTKVEWLDTIEGGPGYHIRKLRYEALPGWWIPALLYVPDKLEGKVPVVMNVNGHDGEGKLASYKQVRCINQAKRGMIALNPEWIGMGQLKWDDYAHNRMNQIDLCGASGLAPFYLTMQRGLDLLLGLENADPERVAVAGLSGGGWQTIYISSLDPRVTLANPVAGYSSFFTRVHEPSDLGDSEQTPVDMATIADYCHLTAMRAPRPTLLTYNAKDNCCFVADGALPPLLQAAGPVFELFGKRTHLRSHVNYIPGTHNFEIDNRLELYRMFGKHFYPGDAEFVYEEIPCQDELKTKEQLEVELPEGNANFHSLATSLAVNLPRDERLPSSAATISAWQAAGRERLTEIAKVSRDDVTATQVGEDSLGDGTATYWQLKVGGSWTVPVTELVEGEPKTTVILVADQGRAEAADDAKQLLEAGHRVLALDPFYFGESAAEDRDYLYGLLISCVGERLLGVDAGQLAAASRWAAQRYGQPVEIFAIGPRASLYTLVAAALETDAIGTVTLQDSFGSLKEIIEQNMSVSKTPDLFCFGLLEYFDVNQLTALVAPRQVKFAEPSERVQRELTKLKDLYGLLDSEFDPLN